MALFKNQTAGDFNQMMGKLIGLLKKHGPQSLLQKASSSLPKELRETAFAVAADLVFVDGSVEDDEKELLETIQRALEVPDDLAPRILEGLIIKNRGCSGIVIWFPEGSATLADEGDILIPLMGRIPKWGGRQFMTTKFNQCPNPKCERKAGWTGFDVYECKKCGTHYCLKCGNDRCPTCASKEQRKAGYVAS